MPYNILKIPIIIAHVCAKDKDKTIIFLVEHILIAIMIFTWNLRTNTRAYTQNDTTTKVMKQPLTENLTFGQQYQHVNLNYITWII